MESIGFACVVFWPIILVAILIISSIVTAGGAVGLLSDRKRRGAIWRKSSIALAVGLIPLLLCGLPLILPKPPPPTPEPVYALTNEEIKPVLKAINQSNRLSLGFLPFPANASVKVHDYGSEVNVEIFVGPYYGWECGDTRWGISLTRVDDTLKVVGESETHVGPQRYENLLITYSTDPKASHPDTLVIEYRGEDPRLKKSNLTLGEARPVLVEWERTCANPTPEK